MCLTSEKQQRARVGVSGGDGEVEGDDCITAEAI